LTRIWRDQLERSLRRFASDHFLGSQWRRGVEVLISPGGHGAGAATAGSLWPVEGHISGCSQTAGYSKMVNINMENEFNDDKT